MLFYTGNEVVIVKNGLRICGSGGALTNAPLLQNKSYFEVKIQQGGIWGIGLARRDTDLNVAIGGKDSESWALDSDGIIRHNEQELHKIQNPVQEGDVIVCIYCYLVWYILKKLNLIKLKKSKKCFWFFKRLLLMYNQYLVWIIKNFFSGSILRSCRVEFLFKWRIHECSSYRCKRTDLSSVIWYLFILTTHNKRELIKMDWNFNYHLNSPEYFSITSMIFTLLDAIG